MNWQPNSYAWRWAASTMSWVLLLLFFAHGIAGDSAAAACKNFCGTTSPDRNTSLVVEGIVAFYKATSRDETGSALPPIMPTALQGLRPSSAVTPKRAAQSGWLSTTGGEYWRWYMAAGGALIAAQFIVLAALGRKCHRYRAAAAGNRLPHSEFLHLSRLAIIGELTASIAHEINQPLGAILSNAEAAEMLLDSNAASPDVLRQILGDIRRDDIRASEVIGHIRSLLGKRVADMRELDLTQVANNALHLIDAEARRRGVTINTRFAAAVPPVLGDRVQLEQVLLNLLLNGMQAMADKPEDERQLHLLVEANGDERVVVTVIDAGPGIPPDQLAQLFSSFFTTRENGMGLGLSIVRSIVEAHGGSIDAANHAGGGAVFHFTLPAHKRRLGSEVCHEQTDTHSSYH
jgi:signal transduction histidine kinase